LRVLSAEKSGKQSLDIAGLLKIRGSEIQQRYSELDDAGCWSLQPALHRRSHGRRLAGRSRSTACGWRCRIARLWLSTYFNMRKTTIYGGFNEVQRNIVAQTVLGMNHGL
jgi:alkylation response protein AidB-like acyl-CoA dehydrogenase